MPRIPTSPLIAPYGALCAATAESESAFPNSSDAGVRLTGDGYRRIKEWSISHYDKEDLAGVPVTSPDKLDLTIEEDQPVVYLVIAVGESC